MTRKHFEAIASIIKNANEKVPDGYLDEFDSGHQDAVEDITIALVRYFVTENPNFDTKRFLTACGMPGMVIP